MNRKSRSLSTFSERKENSVVQPRSLSNVESWKAFVERILDEFSRFGMIMPSERELLYRIGIEATKFLGQDKLRILREAINYLDTVEIQQIRDLYLASRMDRMYFKGEPIVSAIVVMLKPVYRSILGEARNGLEFVHKLLRKIVGLSPLDIARIAKEIGSGVIDDIWKMVRGRIDEETFKRYLAWLHYELGAKFSEAFGRGWDLPGILRAYSISLPSRIDEILRTIFGHQIRPRKVRTLLDLATR